MAVQHVTPAPPRTAAPPSDHDGLKVRGLEVVYNNAVTALSGVSLDVAPGAFVSVLGANGAGKTTLVRTITGLLFVHGGRVRDGHITFGDLAVTSADASAAVRGGICQVPEGRMLFPRLTVEENLRIGAATRSDRAAISRDVEEKFELFPQLADRRSDKAGFLSGGEQQMVAVGRALMARPTLLICDELSLGLAPMIVRDLFELLSRLNREEGLSVLVIEQNARMALAHSTYGYVLETGRLAVEGTSEELGNDPHVQETYLGGGGEAKDAYEAVVSRYTGRRGQVTTMADPILSLDGVTVQFGGLKACDDVAFEVQRGEMFALIGPNGAGKTTVVNAITGIYQPVAGATITYTDREGTAHSLLGHKPHDIVRYGVARTFQNLGLFPSLSVLDNLMLGRYIHQHTGVLAGGFFTRAAVREELESREAVEHVIDLLEIPQYRWDPVGDLPYGVQKRIELGRVLAMEPDLLLLDEPMAGMTVEEKIDIVRFIYEVRLELGVTVVLIEHDMAVVMSIAERVMALNFGQAIALGTPAEVQGNAEVVEAYLGAE